jgi:hypothetical protein
MTDLLQRARAFARKAHDDAGCAYGAHPFSYHLDAVTDTLVKFGHADERLLAAAQLHDVVEDTPVTPQTIFDLFGLDVGSYVDAVTDIKVKPDGTPCKNRKERQQLTYAKLRDHAALRPEVLNLKLADRIANVEASAAGINSRHFTMYQTEHPFFCREVGRVGGDEKMWAHLDRLVSLDPRRGPVRKVCNAIRQPGPHPEFHEKAVAVVQSTWPTLWKALEDLMEVDPL